MLISSSGWPVLLCLATLLSWLMPALAATTIKTSDTFKVLTDDDKMGGSCTSKMSQVDALLPEVQALIKAATTAIDDLLDDPGVFVSGWLPSKKKDRMRLLLLAQQFFGTEFDAKKLKVYAQNPETGNDSQSKLKEFRQSFQDIKNEIEKKNKNYRFACGDTWLERVSELKTALGQSAKGTQINEVPELKGSRGEYEYAWYDKGGPELRPTQNDPQIQRDWYFTAGKPWPKDGPCAEQQNQNGQKVGAQAETIYHPTNIIFFCDRVWDQVQSGRLKKDVREFKKSKISTDGDAYLDSYMSPGSILLHEMTHQVWKSQDNPPAALGYEFSSVSQGRQKPERALFNADTYPYFAVAAYLSQVEWHSGKAQKIGTGEQ